MYIARKPFRYENKVFMQGEHVTVTDDDVRMLQGQGKIGGRVMETASVKPPEQAVMPKAETKHLGDFVRKVTAEPKHLGGGYYELPNGEKVRGKKAAEEAMKAGD